MHSKIQFKGKNLHLLFIIVGLGANGSHFFRGLCQDLRTHINAYYHRSWDRPFSYEHILLIDGDKVEEKNLGNQIFERDEIGVHKTIALSERYGEHYELDILRVTDYIQDVDYMMRFIPDVRVNSSLYLPVLIGMVDNHATRKILDGFFRSDFFENMLYLDAGVHGVSNDQHGKPRVDSGNGGQVIVGLKVKHTVIMDSVAGLYPEIMGDTESRVPGCGVAIQSSPQRGATNKFAAQIANNIVNTLLTEKSILVHQVMFDSRMCGANPTFVSKAQMDVFEELTKPMVFSI